MASASGPLVGLRVRDLGTRIGTPFAATRLADLGADVVKVKLPGQATSCERSARSTATTRRCSAPWASGG